MYKRTLVLFFVLFTSSALVPNAVSNNALLKRDLFQLNGSAVSAPLPHSPRLLKIIPLHFRQAKAMMAEINNAKLGLLSPMGKLSFDMSANTLWIYDEPTRVKKLQHFIHLLDHPPIQILLRAKIVNIDSRYVRSLGILFGTNNSSPTDHSASTNNLPKIDTGLGKAIVPLGEITNELKLNIELTALEDQGHAKIMANPELMAINRHEAIIESGEEIPYQEKAFGGNTSVAFKKAVLRLKVKPEVMSPNNILLTIALNQDKVSALTVNGVPAIRTQQLSTQAMVHNNATIVLGGIFENVRSHQRVGVPGLDRIPLLGKLFQQQEQIMERKILLIFITPRIVK